MKKIDERVFQLWITNLKIRTADSPKRHFTMTSEDVALLVRRCVEFVEAKISSNEAVSFPLYRANQIEALAKALNMSEEYLKQMFSSTSVRGKPLFAQSHQSLSEDMVVEQQEEVMEALEGGHQSKIDGLPAEEVRIEQFEVRPQRDTDFSLQKTSQAGYDDGEYEDDFADDSYEEDFEYDH